jgi:hypothetical protein
MPVYAHRRCGMNSPFLIFIIAFLAAPLCLQSQSLPSGFYILLKNKKNCQGLLHSMDGVKSFCVPKEPVIAASDFEEISPVKYDSLRHIKTLTLKLTTEGFKSLKFLTQKLPDTRLALVVENKVAGVLDSQEALVSRTIPITAAWDRLDLEWIHDKLKK